VLLARIMVPRDAAAETPGAADLGRDAVYESSIDALIKGIGIGLDICLKIGATLIVFVALVAMIDGVLGLFAPVGGAPLSLERVFGVAFSPLAWCLGVPWKEAQAAGSLLGVKLMLTEFTAFIDLAKLGPTVISDRTRIIMTYALCGFANIASVGINVAGYSVLAPTRQKEVMGMVWKAMLVGFLATCMTASVVGALPSSLFAR
jgi:concentrative nucleoside transporter, CNT family